MPRYNVQRPSDGKWACFSTVTDSFITKWMRENRYQAWRRKEYGMMAGSLSTACKMDYEEALERQNLRKWWENEN
jgi:hypothetical protein